VISVVVTIRMATVQHLVMDNKKRRPIICRTKLNLNETFKEATKAIEVAQVQISLMAGDHKILVPPTLLL